MNITKCALSFSLFGTNPIYSEGMFANVPLCKFVYPDWDVVVHVEKGHSSTNRLIELGAIVIERDPCPLLGGMKWRFETMDDTKYDIVVSRDADSVVGQREKSAVDAWLKSGKALHVMRDHPNHVRPIMGGMFGIRVGSTSIKRAMGLWDHSNLYGDDEDMLESLIWPKLENDAIIHTSNTPLNGEIPFPIGMVDGMHVGERIKTTLLK